MLVLFLRKNVLVHNSHLVHSLLLPHLCCDLVVCLFVPRHFAVYDASEYPLAEKILPLQPESFP
jgi:hypothetical protein